VGRKILLVFFFFISLLTLLNGIIQMDGVLAGSEVVTRRLGLSWIAGRLEEHIIPTKNSGISQVLTFYGKGRIIMRQDLVVLVMVPVLWGRACWAQQSAASAEPNGFKPESTNVLGSQYPQVNSARQAMFRIYENPNSFKKNIKVFFLGADGRGCRSNLNIWNLLRFYLRIKQ
jgi:hypothetical protein